MDWRNPENYAYTSTHDDAHWAWEFLRRDKRYCGAWERELPAGLERNQHDQRVRNLPVDHPSFFLVVGGPEPAKTWGLDRWLNPANPAPTYLVSHWRPAFLVRFHVGHAPFPSFRGIPENSRPAVDPGKCAVIFDLGRSLIPQMKAAKAELEAWQKIWLAETGTAKPARKKRSIYAKFSHYLQVLDAKEAGATLAEIAETFPIGGPDDDPLEAAGRTLEQAQNWVKDYRSLLVP